MSYQVLHGDCLAVLKTLPDNSVDSVVTDPPYGLTSRRPGGRSEATRGAVMGGFMGLKWDYDVPSVEVWAECLRVLKPGGHLLAFAGTRTQHRMACRIEDAGFDIRDMIAWVYGSGFPKSLDVSKAIDKAAGAEREVTGVAGKSGSVRNSMAGDFTGGEYMTTAPSTVAARQWQGWGTALKPALEPITVARKPLNGTVAENVLAHGTGALNIDGCRVETTDDLNGGAYAETGGREVSPSLHGGSGMNVTGKTVGTEFAQPTGRWPANLIHDGSDEVLAAFPQAPGQVADASTNSGMRKIQNTYGALRRGRGDEPSADSDNEGAVGFKMKPGARRLDSGSAARFFYCPKASKKDRGEGNNHPTVKPTDLMRYLCRLVTPPSGVVLDPFLGSGTTGKAAMLEGFRFIGIEMDADYVALAEKRIAAVAPDWRIALGICEGEAA